MIERLVTYFGKSRWEAGPRSFLVVFGLLGFFLTTHFLLGGVVMDSRETGTGYELFYRDPNPHWEAVHAWTYWLSRFAYWSHLVLVVSGLGLAFGFLLYGIAGRDNVEEPM